VIRFSFRQLAYFVATAEQATTLRAAQSLGVSQPAVSAAIGQLEAALGGQLFIRRHAQGVVLSPFGRQKLAEVRRLLAHATTIAGKDETGPMRGELHFGVFATLAPAFAPAILRDFADAHPAVAVRIREGNLEQLRRDLANGAIELALLYGLDMGDEINRVVVGEFMPYVALPARHPLARLPAISLSELVRETFVLIDLPGSREHFLSMFQVLRTTPAKIIRCSSLEMVRGMVANGHGVAILVTRPSGDRSYDGKRLACRPLVEPVPPQNVVIASAAGTPQSRIARSFIETSRRFVARSAVLRSAGTQHRTRSQHRKIG
jgi:DNA-binding transcriptional LysR family regulator